MNDRIIINYSLDQNYPLKEIAKKKILLLLLKKLKKISLLKQAKKRLTILSKLKDMNKKNLCKITIIENVIN